MEIKSLMQARKKLVKVNYDVWDIEMAGRYYAVKNCSFDTRINIVWIVNAVF